MTALRSLERMQVGPNDTLVVYGAAGGVGSMGVQIGRARGARVIGTASERNHDFLSALGVGVLRRRPVGRIPELAPDGVTAVADFVGGQLQTTLAVLAPGGRHVSTVDNTVEQHGGQLIWCTRTARGSASSPP